VRRAGRGHARGRRLARPHLRALSARGQPTPGPTASRPIDGFHHCEKHERAIAYSYVSIVPPLTILPVSGVKLQDGALHSSTSTRSTPRCEFAISRAGDGICKYGGGIGLVPPRAGSHGSRLKLLCDERCPIAPTLAIRTTSRVPKPPSPTSARLTLPQMINVQNCDAVLATCRALLHWSWCAPRRPAADTLSSDDAD
jgi:hypothetical protein